MDKLVQDVIEALPQVAKIAETVIEAVEQAAENKDDGAEQCTPGNSARYTFTWEGFNDQNIRG